MADEVKEDNQSKLLSLVRKASREVAKYLLKPSSLQNIINDGDKRIAEYVDSIRGINLRGTSGAFRLCKKEKKVQQEIQEAQENLNGKKSWEQGCCPNCGNTDIQYCTVCFTKVLAEISRVRSKNDS